MKFNRVQMPLVFWVDYAYAGVWLKSPSDNPR